VTDAPDGHHLSGEVVASTAATIGRSLSAIPHTRLEISSEVAFEGDAFDIAIYPSRSAPEGGEDFLIGGNIWLPAEQARSLVAAIGAALDRGGLRYELDLAIEQDVSATETTKHAGYDAMMAARTRTTGSAR
jgi:hypothetical protein